MKPIIPLLGLFLAVSSLADTVLPPHITVYGTATTEVVPNQMIWSLHVENRGHDLNTVAAEQTKIVQGVLDFLKQTGVESKSLQTSRMAFGENCSRTRDGYIASTDVSFKINQLDLYQPIWLGLAGMPAVSVQGVSYDHTRRIDFQNETREKAIVAAKEKAASCARVLGVELGPPLALEEDQPATDVWGMGMANNMVNNLRAMPGAAPARDEVVAPGTIPITIRVKAEFQLVTKPK